jgi:EAL domain-containing protein (putative c-di-GMP-specific phosphodiesterase class I)/GGDEF domain-containing protein
MSLLNQIIAAVFTVLIGLVSGTIYIMSDSSKSMLLNQLESHSHDTATHLGLYMAPYVAESDSATIETIVNAIFDSGYYEKIQVTDFDHEDLFTALRSPEISDDVPNWFVKLIAFDTPTIEIEVTHSWAKVGFIVVKSRAGYAYEELWKGTQTTLIWFITLSLICVVFLSSLIRLILRPLKSIEQQATALSNKEYLEVTKIPRTKELKSVVVTMNSMIQRVQTMFEEQTKNIEELRRTAYIDELTQLANARSFNAQLTDKLDNRDDEGPCALFYVHITNLALLNEQLGEENASYLIQQIAHKLSNIANSHLGSVVGRVSGSDLAVLIPLPEKDALSREVSSLLEGHKELFDFHHPKSTEPTPIHIAVVTSSESTSSAQILSVARIAIEEATQEKVACIYKSLTDKENTTSDWKSHVADAINNKKLFLQYQEVLATDNQIIQKELLVRILNQEGEPCSAIRFIRIVQELGLIEALDKAVIELAIEHTQASQDDYPLAINISKHTLHDNSFDNWLVDTIKGKELSNKLSIEVNESSVLNDVDRIVTFRQLLSSEGIGFGVDNFGVHPSGFSYLYKVQPDYIKIDGSLCHEIETNAADRFFMSSLITVANSLSIPSYAERIEHKAQIEQLQKLGISATQGFIHGKPKNLN